MPEKETKTHRIGKTETQDGRWPKVKQKKNPIDRKEKKKMQQNREQERKNI